MDMLKPDNDENITLNFHEACKRGDLDKVTNLLQRKEEIDVKQLDKKFTLGRTVQNEDSGIVQSLLRIGINVNQKHSPTGIRPLHYACAAWGNLAIAKILLDNGADINATDKCYNRTALHFAVSNKKTSITKLLLKYGCKTNVKNHRGHTALELAMKKGYVDVMKQLAFNNKNI